MPNNETIIILATIFGGFIGFAALITAISTAIGSARRGTVDDLSKAFNTLCDDYERLKKDIASARQENSRLQETVNSLIKENRELNKKLLALELESKAKDITIQSLRDEIQKLTVRYNQSQKE